MYWPDNGLTPTHEINNPAPSVRRLVRGVGLATGTAAGFRQRGRHGLGLHGREPLVGARPAPNAAGPVGVPAIAYFLYCCAGATVIGSTVFRILSSNSESGNPPTMSTVFVRYTRMRCLSRSTLFSPGMTAEPLSARTPDS